MQEESNSLQQVFLYTREIPLMGFKGQFDDMLKLISKMYEQVGIGKDVASYTAYLKLHELQEEIRILHELHKLQTISLTTPDPKAKVFWLSFQHISGYMKSIITSLEKEKVTIAMALGEEHFNDSQQMLKHCANELNRIRHLLQSVYV